MNSPAMAMGASRLYLLLRPGSSVYRIVQPTSHVQTWCSTSTSRNFLLLGQVEGARLHHSRASALWSRGRETAHLCAAQSNSFTGLQLHRNYCNKSEVPGSQNAGSPSSSSRAGSGSSVAQGGKETAKAQSSTERIKIILREYGTVAFVFHISMSLCTLGTCYILVSKLVLCQFA